MPTAVELLGITDTTDDGKFGQGLRSTANAFAEAIPIFEDAATLKDWKLKTEMKGDKCYNKHFSVGKVYTLQKEFPLAIQPLFDNHWHEIEETPKWNQNVQAVKKVATISDHADVLHYATSDVVVVKGRDFVVCRMWRKVGDAIVVVASSFDNDIPALPKKKRGWVNLCSGRFAPHPNDANRTIVTYLVCVDLKDKLIPKAVVSSGIAEMAIKDARFALKYLEEQLEEEEKKNNGA